MRLPIAMTLLALPATLSAQIAPSARSGTPSAPVNVRIDASGNYEMRRSREAIRDGRRSGTLTKDQARALRREASQNDALAERYARDGLSQAEQRELDMRGRALQSLTEAQRTQPRRP